MLAGTLASFGLPVQRPLQKCKNHHFRHSGLDQESSIFKTFWIPAFAGMTAIVGFCKGLVQGVAVILGVDASMDKARIALNIIGNCLASVVIARWEGKFVADYNAEKGTST